GIGCTTAPSGDEEAIPGAVRSRIADCEAHRPQAFDLAKQPRMRSGSTSAAGRGMATPRDPCGAALGALRRAANLSPRPFTTLEDELPNCHPRANRDEMIGELETPTRNPAGTRSVRRRDPRGRHVAPLSFLRPPLARARSPPAHKTGGQDHMH